MKFLAELLTDYRRLDVSSDREGIPEPSEQNTGEYDLDSDQEIDDTLPGLDQDEFGDGEEDSDIEGITNQAMEDPNRAGLIRTVKGAHLVYKRKVEDGTYEELWMYNISSVRNGYDIRRAILAGTDIPVNKTQSPDGDQTYTIWSVGNAELINIEGLPN